jgi:hypothetical protein
MTEEDETKADLREKGVQFYAASVGAWFTSRIEFDKSLLTLSSAGIGLLVTLLSSLGIHSVAALLAYEAALLAFIVCLGAVLWALRRNSTHLEQVNSGNDAPDPLLGALDTIAAVSFVVGAVITAVLGAAAATHSLLKEQKMSGETQQILQVQPEQLGKSLNNAGAMRPVAPAPAPPAAAPAPAPAAPSQGNGQK